MVSLFRAKTLRCYEAVMAHHRLRAGLKTPGSAPAHTAAETQQRNAVGIGERIVAQCILKRFGDVKASCRRGVFIFIRIGIHRIIVG